MKNSNIDYTKFLNKEELKSDYDNLKTLKAVARKYNVDSSTVKRYMILHNLDYQKQVIYDCNHDFFSQDTEASFYVAGFIAADGCVLKKKPVLSIGLAKKDRDQLEMIKELLEAENPISEYIVKNSKMNPKWNDSYKVDMKITSRQIIRDLERFNIVPRKTHTYTFPEFIKTHPLRHHFIRGYFDGDGGFYTSLKNDGSRTVEQVSFSLRGTENFLSGVKAIFNEDLNLTGRTKNKSPRKNNGIYTLEYEGNRLIEKIIDYLYNNATLYMNRKYKVGYKSKSLGDTRDISEICSEEKLIKLYDTYHSLEKVAKELNISLTTVYNYMNKHNIAIDESTLSKNKRFKNLLTEENILTAYQKTGTIRGSARELNVGATTIKRYIEKYKISLI